MAQLALMCAFCERHGPSILFATSKLELARAKDVFEETPDEEMNKSEDLASESRRLRLFERQRKCGGVLIFFFFEAGSFLRPT